jgi:hypothetical protein
VVRIEISATAEELIAAGNRWQRSYQAWQRAVEHRGRVTERAERRVARWTGGLSLRDWEAARRRRRIKTLGEASAVLRAGRDRPEVQAAVEEAQRLEAVEAAAVLAARLELAEATKEVLGYGRVGRELTGMTSAELLGLARRPRSTSASPAG